MNFWFVLVLSLPTAHTTLRQRCWRALKSSGAAVLRDGVYLLPQRPECQQALLDIAAEVEQGEGRAWLLTVENPEHTDFSTLFERNAEYAALQTEIAVLQSALTEATAHETLKQ